MSLPLLMDKQISGERRVQGLQESLEARFEKLNQDLKILECRTVSRSSKQSNRNCQSIQKNSDQLMSLLSRKLQQYSFADTIIGQNHYKLVQKGMDAPSLERKLQEQRFLAEKELSTAHATQKSIFWMDIQFTKQGIDKYLETNQNFVLFKAVDTMRAASNSSSSFANRLQARKAELRGNASASSHTPRFDSFNSRIDLQQQEATSEIVSRAMKQLSTVGCGKFAEVLSKQSRSFKEVWLLLERMCVANSLGKKPHRRSKQLANSFSRGIQYLENIYRKHKSTKKSAQFQRIYDAYNIDQLRSIEDETIPLWQELYQLFRAGDYQTIFTRCGQYNDVPSVQDFSKDFSAWLGNNQKKLQSLAQKMRPNWDAFKYQIYLIMVKDPQCVDDVFIEDLDDCLWMNLKCCQAINDQQQDSVDDEELDVELVLPKQGATATAAQQSSITTSQEDNNPEKFYGNLLKNDHLDDSNVSWSSSMLGEDVGSPYLWVDWVQLNELRKMLNESFKESPEVFNPSRVLMIQLLTLDLVSFTNTLRSIEKNGISQSELINMLVVIVKSGLLRASTECAIANLPERTEKAMKIIINASKEVEDYAEKQILLYAKDVFEVNPDIAFAYVDAIPRSREIRLERYADLLVGSNQNFLQLFRDVSHVSPSTTSSSSNNRVFENHLSIVRQKLKTQQSSEGRTQLQQLARHTASIVMKRQNKVQTALEILDGVGEHIEAVSILKDQYRISAAVFDRSGMKNQLRAAIESSSSSNASTTAAQQLQETLDRYADKYFSKRAKATVEYSEKNRAEDARIIEFFKLARRIKLQYQRGEYDISGQLKKMQELRYISSPQNESAAAEFTKALEERAGSAAQHAYFDFLYILYLSASRFFESLKAAPSPYSQPTSMKPEQMEKARQIFTQVLSLSNEFYAKHKHTLDKEFVKLVDQAKHEAQTATRS